MPFRFALETVLHLRQSLERQQELRLRAANQQVGRVRHMIELLDGRGREMQAQATQQLISGASAAEVQFGLLCQDTLAKQRGVTLRELRRLEELRDQQQKSYQKARRDRETFASMRERQLIEYRRQATRREQRELDDTFLLRQNQLKNHARHG